MIALTNTLTFVLTSLYIPVLVLPAYGAIGCFGKRHARTDHSGRP
ncbi:hypothetical protein [Streptomyces sp. NPDC058572]